MDHVEGHFKVWDQLQRNFLNEFRPKVVQSTALKALINVRQGRDEKFSAYIRRFGMVGARYVGTLLNDDTLKHFFIQGCIKLGVMQRNPCTLAEAKVAARKMEHIDRDYERLWRRDPQLIPLQPSVEVEPFRPLNQSLYASIESGLFPLAVRKPIPFLALPAPRVDPHIEEVEKRLGATQIGFQEAMMKQFQSLTDQTSLLIKSQHPGLSPQIESGKHSLGFLCDQCQQFGHTRQFYKNEQNRDQRMNDNPPQQNPRGQGQNQNQYGQGNKGGPPPQGHANQNAERKEFHHFCGSFVEDIMSWINVGRRTKIKVIAIVEVHILLTSVVTMIKLLRCQIRWLMRNNMLRII